MKVRFNVRTPMYFFNGKWRPVQVIREQIPLPGGNEVGFTVFRTVDGPIITRPRNHVAFAIRFASSGRETGSLTGFSQLGGDRDLRQFARSMKLVTTLHNSCTPTVKATSPTSATA